MSEEARIYRTIAEAWADFEPVLPGEDRDLMRAIFESGAGAALQIASPPRLRRSPARVGSGLTRNAGWGIPWQGCARLNRGHPQGEARCLR